MDFAQNFTYFFLFLFSPVVNLFSPTFFLDYVGTDWLGKKKTIVDTVCVLRADCTLISNAKPLLEQAQLRWQGWVLVSSRNDHYRSDEPKWLPPGPNKTEFCKRAQQVRNGDRFRPNRWPHRTSSNVFTREQVEVRILSESTNELQRRSSNQKGVYKLPHLVSFILRLGDFAGYKILAIDASRARWLPRRANFFFGPTLDLVSGAKCFVPECACANLYVQPHPSTYDSCYATSI